MNSRCFISNRKVLIIAFSVALVTILIYLPALQNGFVNWDDPDYLYENQYIRSLDFKSLKWMFSTFHMQNWHPLTWLSHAVDYAIWGQNPIGHHLTSIIIHGVNALLVVILVIHLLNKRPLKLSSTSMSNKYYKTLLITATATSLLFALHPLRVESVAWVSERKDILCAFFFLLSIHSYLKYTLSSLKKQKSINYTLCVFFFILALMSKPMAVTLPVVLLIFDIYPLERLTLNSVFTTHRRVLLEKLPLFGLSFVSTVITILAQQKEIVSFDLHLGERILTAFRALGFYLFKMFWPANLYPFYPYPSKISLFSFDYIPAFLSVVCITAFCIWSWKRQKVFSTVWAYYFVTLLPVLGIIKVGTQAAADRYTYLPSLGPTLLLGLGISWLWKKSTANKKRVILRISSIIVLLILALSVLSFITVTQIGIWKDSITLWDRELEQYTIPTAFTNRGNMYLKLGKYQRAIEDYNEAIKLDPTLAKAYNNRGLAYGNLGEYQQAIKDFDTAINLNNRESRAYYNRGNVYKASGNYQKAIMDYNNAIEINPQFTDAYNNRGNTYLKLNNYQRAIEDYNVTIKLNPKHEKAYLNRGIVYENLGNYKQANSDYQISARLGNEYAQDYLRSKGISWQQ